MRGDFVPAEAITLSTEVPFSLARGVPHALYAQDFLFKAQSSLANVVAAVFEVRYSCMEKSECPLRVRSGQTIHDRNSKCCGATIGCVAPTTISDRQSPVFRWAQQNDLRNLQEVPDDRFSALLRNLALFLSSQSLAREQRSESHIDNSQTTPSSLQ